MSKKPLSLRLKEIQLNMIETLMNSNYYDNTTKRIEGCINLLNDLYTLSKTSLTGYFSQAEAMYVFAIYKNLVAEIKYDINLKKDFLDNFEKSINQEEYLMLKRNIDVEVLRNKIYSINDMECFMIINQIVDYWYQSKSIDEMDIVSKKYNMYSIDISTTDPEELERVKNEISLYLVKKFTIVDDINLAEATRDYPSTTIIIKAKSKLDLISKLQLKEKIFSISENKNIDININDIIV